MSNKTIQMSNTKFILEVKPVGQNGLSKLREQLNEFVKENFDLLYEGACRMRVNIEGNYYAPDRIQIKETRLHRRMHLKYAAGHKYNSDYAPTEQQILQTIADLQELLDAAAVITPARFTIQINKH